MNTVITNDNRPCMKNAAGALLLGLTLLVSCTKEPAAELLPGEPETVRLTPSAWIVAGAQVQSRAAVDGDHFPAGNTRHSIGMWVCKHEAEPAKFEPAMPGYGNLLASLIVEAAGENERRDLWKFTPAGTNGTSYDILNVRRNQTVDVYAYYPHTTIATDPTAIPFTTGDSDWMWAEPVPNKVNSGGESSIDVPLRFHHAMTCLRVRINCKYEGNVTLTSMTLTDHKATSDEDSRLYKEGTMNILNSGELTLFGRTQNLTVTYNSALEQDPKRIKDFYIIMPPVENYENEQFGLSFKFNGMDAQTSFKIPNTMMKKDPDNPDAPGETVTITAFEVGKRYTYSLTLDNTMKFEPIDIEDVWNSDGNDIEIEL
ncbi:fimbrillin family protein [uncultured Alistipes sp.]|uniref:fimbrillin family protein n=1 Tax=uncultured Alistipes sp. TaxID=538949 RepID=UPI0026112020|nr:fimbrillin family protein [uncultured Alistipes sp.]